MRCHKALLRQPFALRNQEETVHPIASFRGAGRDTRVGLILA
jgi:hypothetical protein